MFVTKEEAKSFGVWKQVVFGAVVICLCVYRIYSLPVGNGLFVNSDLLILPAFYDDLLRGLGYGTGWHFGAAHFYFPDFAAFAALRFLTGNFRFAIALMGVVLPIAFFVISRAVYVEMGGQNGWTYTLLLTAGYVALVAYGVRRATGLFWEFYASSLAMGVHFGAYLTALLCLLLYLTYSRTGHRSVLIWSLVTMVAAIISDLWFVIYFSVPVLALSLFILLTSRDGKSRQATFLLTAAAVTVGSFLVYYRITPATGDYTSGVSLAKSLESATILIGDVGHAPMADPLFVGLFLLAPLAYVLAYLLIFGVRSIQRGRIDPPRSWRGGDAHLAGRAAEMDILIVYTGASLLATLAFVLTFHLYSGVATVRYLHPFVYSPPLCALIALGLAFERRQLSWVREGRWAVASVVAASALWVAFSRPGIVLTRIFPAPDYVACFNGVGPAAGIAEYWQAKPLIMYSDHKLQVAGVVGNGGTFVWDDNAYWYVDSWVNPGHPPRYSFIFMKRLDPTDITNLYGKPDRVVSCADSEIWFYRQPNNLYARLVNGNTELLNDAALLQHPTSQGDP